MPAITPQALVDETLSLTPQLAIEVFENTLARLAGRHKTKPTPAELGMFFSLAESLRRQRDVFITSLRKHLDTELPGALDEAPDALRLTRLSPRSTSDDLGLIDEEQAREDVAIAGVIKAIQEASAIELGQLARIFDALRGSHHAKRDVNPLRPSVFARLLSHALHELTLAPPARAALLRVCGLALAEALVPVYIRLCKHIDDAEVQSLMAKHRIDEDSEQNFFEPSTQIGTYDDEVDTASHTLDHLIRRMQEHDAQHKDDSKPIEPHALPDLGKLMSSLGIPTPDEEPPPHPTTGPTPFPSLSAEAPPASGESAPSADSVELLSRIYGKVLDDPTLLPEVRSILDRLQPSVLRVAAQDAQVLSDQKHPVWLFINCIASHSAGFRKSDGGRLRAFIEFAQSLASRIAVMTQPTAMLYWEALHEAQQYIDISARQATAKTQLTIEALERSLQRDKWQSILREQVHEQLKQAVVSTTIRAFLEDTWVKAMAETMVHFGPDAQEVQPMIDLVDDLLWSVQPLRHPKEREQLREMLPTLTARLNFGFDLIKWPEHRKKELFDELMNRHARLLSSAPTPQVPPTDLASLAEEDTTPSVHGSLDTIRSAGPSMWSESVVDRAALPTVPVPLGEPDADDLTEDLEAWLSELHLGTWCHLFVQSHWATAQLTWISETHSYYVFSDAKDAQPLSLTRGALLQLRAAGLLAALEERNLVQRAVNNMMQTLDD